MHQCFGSCDKLKGIVDKKRNYFIILVYFFHHLWDDNGSKNCQKEGSGLDLEPATVYWTCYFYTALENFTFFFYTPWHYVTICPWVCAERNFPAELTDSGIVTRQLVCDILFVWVSIVFNCKLFLFNCS